MRYFQSEVKSLDFSILSAVFVNLLFSSMDDYSVKRRNNNELLAEVSLSKENLEGIKSGVLNMADLLVSIVKDEGAKSTVNQQGNDLVI